MASTTEAAAPPTTPPTTTPMYYAMIVDSGPIIKQALGLFTTCSALKYVTTPGVVAEIRDTKARHHMGGVLSLVLDKLIIRDPTPESMQQVIQFSKQTGDYASLSSVDLQVLALTLDMEREGCLDTSHIRTTPKRTVGLGTIQLLNQKENNGRKSDESHTPKALNLEYDVVEEEEENEDDEEKENDESVATSNPNEADGADVNVESTTVETETTGATATPAASTAPKTWAALVNPNVAATSVASVARVEDTAKAPTATTQFDMSKPFGQMKIKDGDGQFDDAEDEDIHTDLQSEFPSLAAASTVPFEGEDDEIAGKETLSGDLKESTDSTTDIPDSYQLTEQEKKKNLQPVSKSGKLYNSFRKYGDLMKPAPVKKKTVAKKEEEKSTETTPSPTDTTIANPNQSKILGTANMGGETMKDDEDDGEGWITSTADMQAIKATHGMLDPSKSMTTPVSISTNANQGPPLSQRAACATTDFAMQNVLLQMNLILLSVDSMRIRRLKSWVIRCGACFKIHSAADDDGFLDGRIRRLFCSHCGSGDMMQRISASVDGKTGRLKLHFSKRKQGKHLSKRGTKFSLPKPGTGNRFQGDLLLREDQLLMGAWNQKVKIRSGNAYQKSNSQSMFGRDLASTVGCNVTKSGGGGNSFGSSSWASSASPSSASSAHDIRVGFGARKNPNAAKGRERRGKKKKSSDRACGMRRY